MDDIKSLKRIKGNNIDSVIVGKAIYENRINIKEAIQYLRGED